MKVLDTPNAGARFKVFLIWGTLLFLVQFFSGYLFDVTPMGIGIILVITLLFASFAGYMTANALQGKTGDKRSSALYGAIVPIFSMLIGWIVSLVMGTPINFSLPIIPMIAGLVGGYISQRRF